MFKILTKGRDYLLNAPSEQKRVSLLKSQQYVTLVLLLFLFFKQEEWISKIKALLEANRAEGNNYSNENYHLCVLVGIINVSKMQHLLLAT